MSKSRLFSGRIKKATGVDLELDRNEFLDISNAEPDLGPPSQDNYILTSLQDGTRAWSDPASLTVGNATNAVNTIISLPGDNSINIYNTGTGTVTLSLNTNTLMKTATTLVDNANVKLGNVTFTGLVTFNNTATYVASTNTVYTDNMIEIHNSGTNVNNTWGFDDGKDVGLRFHYYNAGDKNAALVLANDTKYLEWYNTGAESNSGTFVGATYGTFKTGIIKLAATTATNSTTTGALTVVGGTGIGGNLYVGGNSNLSGVFTVTNTVNAISTQTGALRVYGGAGIGNDLWVGGNLYVKGVITATNIFLGSLSINFGSLFNGFNSSDDVNIIGGNITVTSATSTSTASVAVFTASLSRSGENNNYYLNVTDVASGPIVTGMTVTGTYITSLVHIRRQINGTTGATGQYQLDNNPGNNTSPSFTVTGTLTTGTKVYYGGTGTFYSIYSNNAHIIDSTSATSTTTGALVVSGGAGIGQNLYVGGNLATNSIITHPTGSNNNLTINPDGTGNVTVTADLYISGQIYRNGVSVGYGYTGSLGFTGSRGYDGSRGYTGSVGFTGSAGNDGVDGYIGSRGYTGSQGYIGSRGYTGSVGFTGSIGNDGGIGYIGSRGYDGSRGYTGSQGYTGSIGYTGSLGFTGSIGYIGSASTAAGYAGSFGYAGSIGYTGSASTAAGYTGSAGTTGITQTINTWTPTLLFATTQGTQTYTTRSGNYIKQGNLVQAFFSITISSIGTGAGNFSLGGLPVVSTSTAGVVGSLSIDTMSSFGTEGVMRGSVTPSTSTVAVFGWFETSPSSSPLTYRAVTATDLGGTANITGSITYISA